MKIINIHTHFRLNSSAIEVLNCSPEVAAIQLTNSRLPVSCGIHPWNISNNVLDHSGEIEMMLKLSQDSSLISFGESGIDRAVSIPFEIQEELFVKQAEIAASSFKPIIIHCVRAYSDIIKIRKQFSGSPPWIIHSFNGNINILNQLIKHNFYFSPSVGSVYGTKGLSVLKLIPLNRVFLETDNTGIDIEEIYNRFATQTGMELNYIVEQIAANFSRLFPGVIIKNE